MAILSYPLVIWIIIAIIWGVIEVIIPHLITVWLAIAALFAAIIAFFMPDTVFMQILVFLIITGILLLLTRPVAIRYLYQKKSDFKDSLIGVDAFLVKKSLQDIGDYKVKVNGQRWIAAV